MSDGHEITKQNLKTDGRAMSIQIATSEVAPVVARPVRNAGPPNRRLAPRGGRGNKI